MFSRTAVTPVPQRSRRMKPVDAQLWCGVFFESFPSTHLMLAPALCWLSIVFNVRMILCCDIDLLPFFILIPQSSADSVLNSSSFSSLLCCLLQMRGSDDNISYTPVSRPVSDLSVSEIGISTHSNLWPLSHESHGGQYRDEKFNKDGADASLLNHDERSFENAASLSPFNRDEQIQSEGPACDDYGTRSIIQCSGSRDIAF